jgi:hypothetical protein
VDNRHFSWTGIARGHFWDGGSYLPRLGYLRSSYFQTGCRSLAGPPPRQSLVPKLPSRTKVIIRAACIFLGDCSVTLTDFDAQLPQVVEDALPRQRQQCRHCQSAAFPPHHHSTVLKLPSKPNHMLALLPMPMRKYGLSVSPGL